MGDTPTPIRRLSDPEIDALDPYAFMAAIGKRVIHPGGRESTQELLSRGAIQSSHRVLDAGCGVGATAIQIARRYGAHVTAVDISPLMLERAERNVQAAGMSERVEVRKADILALPFADGSFDRVVAEAVTMFVDRPKAAQELVRVCSPGGKVLATEFFWRKPPTEEVRRGFLVEMCPGLYFDSLDDWLSIYRTAGLEDVEATTGPFKLMTLTGFLKDEGVMGSLAVMGNVMRRRVSLRKMGWMWPRLNRAVPYLGYIALSATRPEGPAVAGNGPASA